MQARNQYHEDLDRVWAALADLADLAGTAMSRASQALADADLSLAEEVIAADTRLDAARAELDDLVFTLLATQQPVAGDLRLLTSAVPSGAALERMGDLAAHIARSTRLRYPDPAVPEVLRENFAAMGRVAVDLAGEVATALRTRDAALAAGIPAHDEAMDTLHRQMFTVLLAPENHAPVNAAIDLSLLGRFYERFGDQAVYVARRVYFTVTAHQLHERGLV